MRGVRKVMRPKFTLMKSGQYNYTQDKVLFRDRDWCIRETHSPKAALWNSYIHHNVTKNIVQQNPWINGQRPDPLTYLKKIGCEWSDLPMLGNHCTRCLNTIPESIMGLWTLHNFEWVQYHSDSEWDLV